MQHARAAIVRARSTPAAHTAFSWLRCASSNRIPKSHTSFSWLRHHYSTYEKEEAEAEAEASKAAEGECDVGRQKRVAASYLIDVDANLLSEDLSGDGDVAFHIRAAAAVGVKRFVVPASSFGSNESVLKLSADYEQAAVIVPCIGVHPFWADAGESWPGGEAFSEQKVQALRQWATANPSVVAAIGECGLDKSPHFPPLDAQLPWFEAQVKLAAELRKPLFVHERLAFSEVMDILARFGFVSARGKSSSSSNNSNNSSNSNNNSSSNSNSNHHCPKVLVHCFTGTREEMMQYVEAGFFIGISGFFLTKRGSEQLEWLKDIPLSRLMIETDAPYMGFKGCRKHPQKAYSKPSRTSPNVPSALAAVAKAVAKVYDISVEELRQATTSNTEEFFGLEPLLESQELPQQY